VQDPKGEEGALAEGGGGGGEDVMRFVLFLILVLAVGVVDILVFTVWAPMHTPQFYLFVGVQMILGGLLWRYEKKRNQYGKKG
jgi:hypothetical protein